MNKTILYSIREWSEIYENNRSRTVLDLRWVAIPNRHDGEHYSRLMLRKDASEIFSAWILILQVASRCQPRGTLLRSDGKPHDAESLSLKTRAPKGWFEKALPILIQMAWLEEVEHSCQEAVRKLSPSCQSGDEGGEGMEGNGKEGMELAVEAPDLVSEVFQAWNELESLPKISSITDKRKKALKQRMTDQFFRDNWKIAICKVKVSSFCNGKNDRTWKADIDWFLKPDSVARIIEGKYDNRTPLTVSDPTRYTF